LHDPTVNSFDATTVCDEQMDRQVDRHAALAKSRYGITERDEKQNQQAKSAL